MIDISVEKSPLGKGYRLVNVSVGDTHIHVGNMDTNNLKAVLEDVNFKTYADILDLSGKIGTDL